MGIIWRFSEMKATSWDRSSCDSFSAAPEKSMNTALASHRLGTSSLQTPVIEQRFNRASAILLGPIRPGYIRSMRLHKLFNCPMLYFLSSNIILFILQHFPIVIRVTLTNEDKFHWSNYVHLSQHSKKRLRSRWTSEDPVNGGLRLRQKRWCASWACGKQG